MFDTLMTTDTLLYSSPLFSLQPMDREKCATEAVVNQLDLP